MILILHGCCLHARHRSQTYIRCRFDASMSRAEKSVGGGEQIGIKRSDFAFFSLSLSLRWDIFILYLRRLSEKARRYCCAVLLGEVVYRIGNILFLETVPARYYLLAVFQKKHRRHHRGRFVALGDTYIYIYTGDIPFPSLDTLLPMLSATVRHQPCFGEIKIKKREKQLTWTKTTEVLCIQSFALWAACSRN